MIHVYHLINSRSQRVIWLLEELGLEYEIIFCSRDSQTGMAEKSLENVHPLGKAPILTDQTAHDITLADTAAIFDYLLEQYGDGRLVPEPRSAEKVFYYYWKSFSEGSFMPNLALKQVFSRITKMSPFFVRPVLSIIERAVNQRYIEPTLYAELDYIEQHLTHNTWFAGAEFSAADALLTFILEAVCVSVATRDKYPKIFKYVDHARTRPAYQHAVKQGRWSTTQHEQYWQ
jgi:glutathione S-transferase